MLDNLFNATMQFRAMSLRRSLDGWKKKEDKREQRRAKKEGREPEKAFPPITLALLVIFGWFLTFFLYPLNILLVLFPLATRNDVIWDFKICIKVAAMITVLYLVSFLIYLGGNLTVNDLTSAVLYSIYTLVTSSLILYVGAFVVRYLSKSKH
jgi:K+-sensing histidine kinase KdpD